jgi:ABC-2 type transport system permease protein
VSHIVTIAKRELAGYFATPVAYVFIVIFLLLASAFTFYLGGLYERGQADLAPFFTFHPWLYLFLIPAISMRLWAEERKSGSVELLLTQPVTLWQAVLGKFLAAWAFTALALALTFPIWITVNYLGSPDNGVILAAYIGSLLMAGGFLAIGSCMSALTRNQVVAFILAVVVCFAFLLAGFPLVLDAFRAGAHRRDRLALLPHPFRIHLERRARRARPALFRPHDGVFPDRDRDHPRRAQGGVSRP